MGIVSVCVRCGEWVCNCDPAYGRYTPPPLRDFLEALIESKIPFQVQPGRPDSNVPSIDEWTVTVPDEKHLPEVPTGFISRVTIANERGGF